MSNAVTEIAATLEPLTEQDKQLLKKYLTAHLQDVLDEARWTESFEGSPQTLETPSAEVDQAIADHDVEPLDPDKL
jgi:hypothetical protein